LNGPNPFIIENKAPLMFFEKSGSSSAFIEFNCYISNKDLWGFWYQRSIDGSVFWSFSSCGKNGFGLRGNRHPYLLV